MAWLTRTTWINTDKPTATDFNNIGNDIRTWGGNVSANNNTLSAVAGINMTGGVGQPSPIWSSAGLQGALLLVQDAGGSGNAGGVVLFAAGQSAFGFAAIKGALMSGASNTTGDLIVSTRRVPTDAATTEAWRWLSAGTASISSSTAPGTPPAGAFYIYMDVADSKIKVKGPSGTVTILALP